MEPVSALDSPKRSSARRGGDVRAGDRRAARAAVGLEHVAVEPERPLAERLEVADRPERPPDQPLDLDRAARPACPSPPRARRARPSTPGRSEYSAVIQPRPEPSQPARHARPRPIAVQSTLRLPLRVEHRPVRAARASPGRARAAAARRRAAVRRRGSCCRFSSVAISTCSTSLDRELQEARVPSRGRRRCRRSSGSGRPPRAPASFSIRLRASVSATSRAVSSAEKTSVTSRPKTRWKIGRMSG